MKREEFFHEERTMKKGEMGGKERVAKEWRRNNPLEGEIKWRKA